MNKLTIKPDFIFHSREKAGVRRHTIVGIIDDNQLRIGYSVTGNYDTFQKKLGTCIATGRAVKCPLKTINLMERKKSEIKILFNDITYNFSKTNPILVLPNYHKSVKSLKIK